MTFTTIHDIDAQHVSRDDANAALNAIARLIHVAQQIDARSSIASNIDAQRVLHEINTQLRVYSRHVNA